MLERKLDQEASEREYARNRRMRQLKFLFYFVIAAIIFICFMAGNNSNQSRQSGNLTELNAVPTSEPQQLPRDEPSAEKASIPQETSPVASSPPIELPAEHMTAPHEVAPEQLVTVTDYANVRSVPNNGPVVGKAFAGEQLAIVQSQGSWAQVRRDGDVIGWVHRSLLAPAR